MFSSSKNDETLLLNIVNKSISDDLVNMKEPTDPDNTVKNDKQTTEPDIKVSLVVTCCPVPKDDCSNCSNCSKSDKNSDCDCTKNGQCDCTKASNDSISSFFTKWFTCTGCCDKKEVIEPVVE